MSFTDTRQQPFPAAPPSLSAGDHEMRDYYAFQNASRPPPNQAPYLTPYLGLRARLSQVWINRWTILLLLVLVRTLLAVGSLNNGIASARKEALSACTSVEDAGSTMASMPHYMSQGVNKLTAEGVTHAVNGLMQMVTMSVTGVEEIVVFVIGMMTNTYLCLITLAAGGGAHLALDLVQEFSDAMNKSLSSVENGIGSGITDFQNTLNKFLDVLPGIPTVSGKPPQINLSKEVNALKAIQMPSDINQKIQQLNASIPTFDQVKSAVDDVIRLPFEELKKLINDSMGTYQFDGTLLPVPQKESLTFCSDNNGINDFFDDLVHISHIARNVFLGVLLTAAFLVCIPMAWWEIQRWRRLQERAAVIGREAVDPMDAVYMASRPYTSQVGSWAASKATTKRHQLLIRWTVAYCTSVPALFVLALALAGLFACLCQYILLASIKHETPNLAAQVGDFSQKVVNTVNNASQQWANGTNNLILTENNLINTDLLGWVNTSTTAVNNTLNEFVNQTITLLDDAFGKTILADPIKDVFNCLIGLKIASFEQGLTWVHDNAHIDFPLLPNNTFTLQNLVDHTNSTADNNFLADPKDTTTDEITEAVDDLVHLLMAAVRQEAIIATIILCFWLLVALMGFVRALYLFLKHDKMRGEGGNEFLPQSHDNGFGGSYEPKATDAPPYDRNCSGSNLGP
ncbi:hypothetical protein NA57DRAFT_69334 [Rhizodiscina lignyota]|uniref:Plasma membrane fusion protein PRM1 n=1 Tax=Rhizodiscina lignyota TaxID=1504668 RepID=A0A9P4M1B0_9PEZI|nr:hypothetical protein NA57DRAFT_69334 [Rhizodiscina lignyota]